jgi:hypothetical protein
MTENNFWTSEQRLLNAEETFSFGGSFEMDVLLSLEQAFCMKKRVPQIGQPSENP